MSPSMAAIALLIVLVGVAPSAADCLSARQAHVMARCGVGEAVIEETAASERYIAARSELEAARLRRERAERRARYAARDHTGERDVCRHLDEAGPGPARPNRPSPGLRPAARLRPRPVGWRADRC